MVIFRVGVWGLRVILVWLGLSAMCVQVTFRIFFIIYKVFDNNGF